MKIDTMIEILEQKIDNWSLWQVSYLSFDSMRMLTVLSSARRGVQLVLKGLTKSPEYPRMQEIRSMGWLDRRLRATSA